MPDPASDAEADAHRASLDFHEQHLDAVPGDGTVDVEEIAGQQVAGGGSLLGRLVESLVALSLRVYAQAAEASVYHLRTQSGSHEVDFIIERDDHRVLALETKLGASVGEQEVEHLRWLRQEIGDDLLDAAVIYTGRYAYRRPDGIAVIPAALLAP